MKPRQGIPFQAEPWRHRWIQTLEGSNSVARISLLDSCPWSLSEQKHHNPI